MRLPEEVSFIQLTEAKLKELWEKVEPFDRLFTDSQRVLGESNFFATLLQKDCLALGIEGGILVMNKIMPGIRAEAHLTFWDRKFSPKVDIIKECLIWAFMEFDLYRIEVRSPEYAKAVHRILQKKLGFTHEGTLRHMNWYKGCLIDYHIFSILREEVLNNGTR